MIFYDKINDVAGTLYDAHTPDSGGDIVLESGFTGEAVVTDANRVRSNSGAFGLYTLPGTPADADYGIRFTVHFASLGASGNIVGGAIRGTGSDRYQAAVEYDGVNHVVRLRRTLTDIGAYTLPVTVGGKAEIFLHAVGDTVMVDVDGVERINVVDPTPITQIGNAQLCFFGVHSNTTGWHLDNIVVSEAFSELVPATDGSDLFDNAVDAAPYSSLSYLKFTTTATVMVLGGTTTLFGSLPESCFLSVLVDGVHRETVQLTANQYHSFLVTLPAGSKVVQIVNGAQSMPSGTVLGTYATFLSLDASGVTFDAPAAVDRLAVYCDSTACGVNVVTDSPVQPWHAWPVLVRRMTGRSVLALGCGFYALKDFAETAPMRAASVAELQSLDPSTVCIAVGINDFENDRWSAADYGTAYAAFADLIRSEMPDVRLLAMTPGVSSGGTVPNAFGDVLQDYRDEIENIASTRSWLVPVRGEDIYQTDQTQDGVHPDRSGHGAQAGYVSSTLTVPRGIVRHAGMNGGING